MHGEMVGMKEGEGRSLSRIKLNDDGTLARASEVNATSTLGDSAMARRLSSGALSGSVSICKGRRRNGELLKKKEKKTGYVVAQ